MANPVFIRNSKGVFHLHQGPLTWCCADCGIATGSPASVIRRGHSNKGDGFCYAENRPAVFVWAEAGPDGRRIR
jgi:hypothetical protein